MQDVSVFEMTDEQRLGTANISNSQECLLRRWGGQCG